jgi:hypothetical protein
MMKMNKNGRRKNENEIEKPLVTDRGWTIRDEDEQYTNEQYAFHHFFVLEIGIWWWKIV